MAPVQKTLDGHVDWKRDDVGELEYDKFTVFSEMLCDGASDMAVSISVTHDINGDVRDFIESSGLKIGLYKAFY